MCACTAACSGGQSRFRTDLFLRRVHFAKCVVQVDTFFIKEQDVMSR